MEENNSYAILNRPRRKRRGITVSKDGRITLRALPCKLLSLKKGDEVVLFISQSNDLYIGKGKCASAPLRLTGRKGQLKFNSVATAAAILSYVTGIPKGATEVDLVVSTEVETIRLGETDCPALLIVTRTNEKFCR